MKKYLHLCITLCILLSVFAIPTAKVYAGNTFTVNTLLDENDGECSPTGVGDGDCSLRDAILLSADGDSINFVVTGTITLTGTELLITQSITINGPGAGSLSIDANAASRVFDINGTNVTITGITIENGKTVNLDGGGIYNSGTLTLDQVVINNNKAEKGLSSFIDGGGIFSQGSLTITNSEITNNTAVFTGGGVSGAGNFSLTNVLFYNNTATGDAGAGGSGGGLAAINNPSLIIDSVTFDSNHALSGGGAYINNVTSATVINSLFDSNTAENVVGGLQISGALGTYTVENTTISGNAQTNSGAGNAGGLLVDSDAAATTTLNHLTVVNNTAVGTGGGAGIYSSSSNIPTIKNSIIANNTAANATDSDCYGSLNSLDYNLIENVTTNCSIGGTTTNNISGTDPELNALANNGGPTKTHSLANTSPALDAIPEFTNGCGTSVTTDQRGATRALDGNNDSSKECDLGAFESPETVTISITSDTPDPSNVGAPVNVFATVTSAGLPTPGGTVSITGADTNCAITLSGGSGSCNVVFSTEGLKTLTATYNGDLNYTSGAEDSEGHTVTQMTVLRSIGVNDGWVLESTETSITGGSLDSTSTTFNLGDDATDKQYRAILHFDTSSLPDNAVITSATLQIRRHSTFGTSPFTILGSLRVDLRKVSFGIAALELNDFKAAANRNNVVTFNTVPVSNWYSGTVSPAGNLFINRTGTTQFKLYFTLDDNDDLGADFIRFFSGNAGTALRPKLIIQYYVP